MTSIDDADGTTPRRLTTSAAQKLGHLSARVWPWLTGSTLMLATVFRLAGLRILAIPLCILFVAAAFGQISLERRHNRRLCEACIIALPLDPGAAAERIRRRLRFVHLAADHAAVSLCAGGAMLATATAIEWLPHARGVAFLALAAPMFCLMAVLLWYMFALEAHRRLAPWCPYCRPPGGGGGLYMPSPEPADSTGRRR